MVGRGQSRCSNEMTLTIGNGHAFVTDCWWNLGGGPILLWRLMTYRLP